jgi:hypothetical protein
MKDIRKLARAYLIVLKMRALKLQFHSRFIKKMICKIKLNIIIYGDVIL